MKNLKVLLVAIALLSVPIAFSQNAFSQGAPSIDSTSPSAITDGDYATMTIYGENLLNSDGSPGSIEWVSDEDVYCTDYESGVDGCFSDEVTFGIDSWDPYGTWITVSYYVYNTGYNDIGSVVVDTDNGWSFSPDVDVAD